MNNYNREELMERFGYCFQVLKAVSDLENAILAEQNRASGEVMGKYDDLRKKYNMGIALFILGCILWGMLFNGVTLDLFSFVFVFGISYGLLWCMFSPVIMVLTAFYKNFAKKEFNKAKTNDVSNAYREEGKELLKDSRFLEYKKEIPATYFNKNDLYLLYSYVENFRADNFKEAANLLAEEKHRDSVSYNQELMAKSLKSIQANARYQSVIQSIQLLETSKVNANLNSINNSLWNIFK